MQRAFRHRSLSRQFLMVSFPVLLAGSLVMGWWIGRQVEEGVVHRIGSVTALYVDAFVGPHVQSLAQEQALSAANMALLQADISGTMLGQKIIALKVWNRSGRVLFSTDRAVIGKQFPIEEGLAVALTGSTFSQVSVRSPAEQIEHGQPLARLIETYTPIHEDRTGRVIAAAEFYERPDALDRLAGAAQRSSWIRIAAIMAATYLSLFLLVRRGSLTIDAQQSELSDKVTQLTALNAQNGALQARVIDAAERATALNENFLQRVSADIHDGPGQDLGFALMQIKNMDDALAAPRAGTGPSDTTHPQPPSAPPWAQGLRLTQVAIESALKDLRAISADIELPDITRLELGEIAARVVRDLRIKTGVKVELLASGLPASASYRLKVALYRLLQESLANTVRHAAGAPCRVQLSASAQLLQVQVQDHGPGFDPLLAAAKGRLGLHGMRQRVEVLGGVFELSTAPGAGTLIRVALPLTAETSP
jgi:signal transduction histidine kinase